MGNYSVSNKANTIVIEDLGRIEDKISEKVYLNADRILYKIIKKAQNIGDEKVASQIANVISFLGKRGRGKTSAMLSFYGYLNNLQNKDSNDWSSLRDIKSAELSFHTIDYIDTAMLAGNEYIIDVILAKMWDEFNNLQKRTVYYHNKANFDHLVKKVRDDFTEVRKAYLTLKYRECEIEKEIEREREIPAASGLHELATGINLRESIKKLVEDYIKVMDYEKNEKHKVDGYLVIALDDVDMANKHAWEILEQVRRYMNVPRVIILMTADMDRLKNVCEVSYRDFNILGNEASKFAHEYLEKVVPINMRVYMPELKNKKDEVQLPVMDNALWKSQLEKNIIFEMLAKECQIYFSPNRRKRHYLQNNSLRTLVNYFEKLSMADDYVEWLRDDLQERLIERIEESQQKGFVKKLLEQDYADINNLIINFVNSHNFVIDASLSDYSLGNVLYACNKLEDSNAENIHFINCILTLYSIVLRDIKDDSNLKYEIIGNSMLGTWEYSTLSHIESNYEMSGFPQRMSLDFELDENVVELFKAQKIKAGIIELVNQYKNEIIAWLYCLLFVNIETNEHYDFAVHIHEQIIKTEEADKTIEKQKVIISIRPYMEVKKGYWGFLYKDPDAYRDTWKKLLKEAMKNLYIELVGVYKNGRSNKKDLVAINANIDNLLKEAWNLLYKRNKKLVEPANWALVNSVEVVYIIGKALEKENKINKLDGTSAVEKLKKYYAVVEKELSEVDEYYSKIDSSINPHFTEYFNNRLQVKLLKELDQLDKSIRPVFVKKFTQMAGILLNVDKNMTRD